MGIVWHLNIHERNTPAGTAFSTLERVFSIEAERITRDPLSELIRIDLEGDGYFIKRYFHGGKWMRRYIGRSRVRAEWENLLYFRKLNIPVPDLIAYGEERRCGVFKRGAIVTREITGAMDLASLETEEVSIRKNPWFREIAEGLADMVRRLHDSGFVHRDLKWRNILVTQEPPGVYIIDSPCGRKKNPFVIRRWIIKDLACLDKVARQRLSRTERLWFYKLYRGHDRLTVQDKEIIEKIALFFRGRE